MLKLTRHHPPGTLFMSAANIVALEPNGTYTRVYSAVSHQFLVKETPEQIMTMPEMQRHLNPAMLVTPQFDVTGPGFIDLRNPIVSAGGGSHE